MRRRQFAEAAGITDKRRLQHRAAAQLREKRLGHRPFGPDCNAATSRGPMKSITSWRSYSVDQTATIISGVCASGVTRSKRASSAATFVILDAGLRLMKMGRRRLPEQRPGLQCDWLTHARRRSILFYTGRVLASWRANGADKPTSCGAPGAGKPALDLKHEAKADA